MEILTNFLIGISLSMDAFSISVILGGAIKERRHFNSFKSSFFFGFAQFFMPVLGWFTGKNFIKYIFEFDHIVAFLILFFIGIKMIYEARKIEKSFNMDKISTLLLLSIATSIDAYAVGLTFSILKIKVLLPSLIIGFTTFTVCLLGFYFGGKLKKIFGEKLEFFGGVILILIGFKILFQT